MSGLDGYFVGEDANGDTWVWRSPRDYPTPVLAQRTLHDDLKLWDAIVELVEGTS